MNLLKLIAICLLISLCILICVLCLLQCVQRMVEKSLKTILIIQQNKEGGDVGPEAYTNLDSHQSLITLVGRKPWERDD